MGRRHNTPLERQIIEALDEWAPQHLTAEELALIIGTSSRQSILATAQRLALENRVRIDPSSHYGLNARRPAHRIYAA